MDEQEKFDQMVAQLYEAAINPTLWRPALVDFSGWVGAQAFHMFAWDRNAQEARLALLSHDDLVEEGRLYGEYYGKIDPVRERALEAAPGMFFATQEHFDDRFVNGNEYFQDFLIPRDHCWTTGGTLLVNGVVDTVLALVRDHKLGRFSAEELARGRRFWYHFDRATSLFVQTERLRQHAHLGAGSLENIELGVVATNDSGRVIFCNRQAEAMLQASGCLSLHGGRLGAAEAALEAALSSAVASAARQSVCSSIQARSVAGQGEELLLTVAPLRESATSVWTVLDRPAVLILIRSRDRQRMLTVNQLMQFFRLTPAEARLARALAHGKTVDEYTLEAGLSVPTARTQLRSILEKTGTRRQTDLLRLLVSIPQVRG